MKRVTLREISRLEPPTILNRMRTGWYVTTGRLPLFKKRPTRFIDAIGLSAVAIIPSILAIAVFVGGFMIGEIDGRRATVGVLAFTGFIVFAVVTSYGSLRYHLGGAGSETD